MGDFNSNVDVSCSSLTLSCQLIVLSDRFSFMQLMSSPTHTSHTGSTSIIELVYVQSNVHASSLVLPPVSSSDHNSRNISSFSSPFKKILQAKNLAVKLSTFFPQFNGINYFLLTLISPGNYLKIDFSSHQLVSPPNLSHPPLATLRLIITFES